MGIVAVPVESGHDTDRPGASARAGEPPRIELTHLKTAGDLHRGS
ncbi:hypothetical protein [Roseateles chitosanitabidus]|jgi:hypothetical protein|nr:hypothetical protein [Roseateles chitosanitabidus]